MGGVIITTHNAFYKRTPTNLIGEAVSAASSLVGGLFGQKSQSDANKTNLQIARETNASNQQLAQQQNQWNIDQWNRENEYNSPAAQKQRLIDAGMNPMFSDVSPGIAQSVQSAPMANQQMAHVEPVDALSKAIPNATSNAVSSIVQLATAKKAMADADTATAQAKLANQEADYNDSANPRRIIGMDLSNSSQQLNIEGLGLENRNTELRNIQQEGLNALTNLQVENEKINLSLQQQFGAKFKQAELDKLIAEKGQIDSSTDVNAATLSKIAADIAKNYAEIHHLNADTKTINSLRPYIIQKMGLDNLGAQLGNLSTEYELGLNLKYGDKTKGQQLKTQEYENSFAGRARSWVTALGVIFGTGIGAYSMYKGAKGGNKKVGSDTYIEHLDNNGNVVNAINKYTKDHYE